MQLFNGCQFFLFLPLQNDFTIFFQVCNAVLDIQRKRFVFVPKRFTESPCHDSFYEGLI